MNIQFGARYHVVDAKGKDHMEGARKLAEAFNRYDTRKAVVDDRMPESSATVFTRMDRVKYEKMALQLDGIGERLDGLDRKLENRPRLSRLMDSKPVVFVGGGLMVLGVAYLERKLEKLKKNALQLEFDPANESFSMQAEEARKDGMDDLRIVLRELKIK